jgi:ATP-dependent DNA ligase
MGRRGPPRVRAVAEPACPAWCRCGRAAEEWPALFVAFDLLRLSGTDTTGWPYRGRRAALESLFAARQLSAPWTLCPSTTEADVVREWLTWASVGTEGWSSRD